MSCWIETVPEASAAGRTRAAYDAVRRSDGTVHKLYQAQSLRPHTILGHDALYRSVLHHPDNRLPGWFLESVAVQTAMMLGCHYAVAHHFANVRRLVGKARRARAIRDALAACRPGDAFAGKELALLGYAAKLTQEPASMARADIETLRAAGANDGEILEVNQVAAAFAYSCRVINGLGIRLDGEAVGFEGTGA